LVFNQTTAVTAAEVAAHTGLTAAEVEAVCSQLLSRRSGPLLAFMRGRYRVNPEAVVPGGVVSVPLAFPGLPANDDGRKSAVDSNRERQVEAAIMVVMKRDRSLEKGDLRQRVKELLQFRMDDELFENRLAHLAQHLYLKLDSSGHVHYLP
jgi:hypothetical protein